MKAFKELKEATENMDNEERKEFYKRENIRNELYILDKEVGLSLHFVIINVFVVIFFIFSAWFIGVYMMTPIGMLCQGIALGVFARNLLGSLFKLEDDKDALRKFLIYNNCHGTKFRKTSIKA